MPYLVLARPTPALLWIGGAVAALGLFVRAWAAGTIDKDGELATSGPFAHTRNPMYLGSLVIGLGLSAMGGHWVWPVAFLVLFLVVYLPTMSREAQHLTKVHGTRFVEYASHVPAFVPRVTTRAISRQTEAPGFDWARYRRYREWEALLGVLAVLAVMALKLSYR